MAEQHFSVLVGVWWTKIPWGWLTLILASFFVGQLLADWVNKNSWLRQKIEHHRRIFEIEQMWTPRIIIDEAGYIGAKARLRFVKSVENVTILVQVFALLTNGKPKEQITWVVEKNISLSAGEQRDICLAVVPQKWGQYYSGWGDKPNHYGHVVQGSENLVSIEVESGKWRQNFRLRLDAPSQNSGANGLLNLLSENDNPFDISELH